MTVPVLTWESWLFTDMGFAATEGETSTNLTQLTITDPTHPIAAGYSGTQTVSSGGNKFSHAYTLGSGAEPVATTTSATEYVIFAYDTAAQMNSGTAAARRVGFNWTYGTPDTANTVGWDLFDAAVDWAAGTQSGQSGNQPPVVSQITATPAATITLPTDTVTLDAVTSDPDSGPNPLTYTWSVTSAPTGGTVTFGTPTAEDTSATFNIAGSYTLRLTADDSTDTAVADITITVNPQPPAVSTRVTYSIAGQTVAVANDSTLTWILGDHQGSTSTAITAGQATTIRYNPYGTQRGTSGSALPTDRTYTGQTADPTTGLMYYRARYYNPAVGQFTQPDTATPPGPPGLNRHAYTNSNPIGFTDPTGHDPSFKDELGYRFWKLGQLAHLQIQLAISMADANWQFEKFTRNEANALRFDLVNADSATAAEIKPDSERGRKAAASELDDKIDFYRPDAMFCRPDCPNRIKPEKMTNPLFSGTIYWGSGFYTEWKQVNNGVIVYSTNFDPSSDNFGEVMGELDDLRAFNKFANGRGGSHHNLTNYLIAIDVIRRLATAFESSTAKSTPAVESETGGLLGSLNPLLLVPLPGGLVCKVIPNSSMCSGLPPVA